MYVFLLILHRIILVQQTLYTYKLTRTPNEQNSIKIKNVYGTVSDINNLKFITPQFIFEHFSQIELRNSAYFINVIF